MPDQYLHGVEVIEIDDGARAIKTVKSSVIGLVGTAPQGPVNTPILINGSPTEAVKYFGNHVDGFTIIIISSLKDIIASAANKNIISATAIYGIP